LRTKYFHGVSSGKQPPYLLKSRYGKVRNVRIPRYDPNNPIHNQLAALSQQAHEATAAGDIAQIQAIELTFRTLFCTSETILEEPPAERRGGAIYRLCHALQPIVATLLSS
jgi:hypothetical protein